MSEKTIDDILETYAKELEQCNISAEITNSEWAHTVEVKLTRKMAAGNCYARMLVDSRISKGDLVRFLQWATGGWKISPPEWLWVAEEKEGQELWPVFLD